MENLPKFIIVTAAMILTCKCQEFAFFRCNNSTKSLQFIYANGGAVPIYDIYARSMKSTCGLRAGVFTGSGSVSDPYTLDIDLSGGLARQDPLCGVTQAADGTVQLEMLVQSSCEGVTLSDSRFSSTCRMVIPASSSTSIKGEASYSCISPKTILFNFSRSEPEVAAPADIYASGKRATCSRSAGTGSGQGVTGDPFTMRIDATNSLTDCGVQDQGGNVYSVVMYVQQYPSVLTSSDASFLLTCNFTSAATQTLETIVLPAVNNPPTNIVTPSMPIASLSVVSASGSGIKTSLVVGEQIRLVAQLLDGPASGLRMTSCEARPGPGLEPVLLVLDSNGCSTSPALVPYFIGQSPTGMVAITNVFDAFKFDQSDTVYFQCQATFCFDSDLTCLGSHCDQKRRRKREVSVESTHTETLGLAIVVRDKTNSSDSKDRDVTIPNLPKWPATTQPSQRDGPASSAPSPTFWPLSAIISISCIGAACLIFCLSTACLLARGRHASKSHAEERDDVQSRTNHGHCFVMTSPPTRMST